jgi:dTDP-4-dehydrorhamnose reductase
MNSLIIGARGLVGSALKKQIPNAIEGIPVEPKRFTNQVYTDVTKYETLFKVFSKYRPDVVYLTAAIAHVDRCEESAGTDTVNVQGAKTVLRLCESFGSKLVYFSSSYVFDGEKKEPYKEVDDPNPVNYYGKQKLMVEDSMNESYANTLIIRTVGVYGAERLNKNFAKQVLSTVFSDKDVYAPSDQYMNPILSNDLARCVVQLVNKNVSGIVHVAGDECISKYEFAKRIARYFGMENRVLAVKTKEMHQKAKRPSNGCLNCDYLKSIGITVPYFEGGLVKFVSMPWNYLDEQRAK